MFPFDPSQLDPRLLEEMSTLVRQLPPEKLNQMQTLMHNAMAGHDVRKEMADFEVSLPSSFREKMTALALKSQLQGATKPSAPIATSTLVENSTAPSNLREARLTLLKGVAAGQISPEDAERLLFVE